MTDLETAKILFNQKKLTLVIVRNHSVLFETQSHKITGFLNAVEQLGKNLEDASIADRVVGKAVALLCVYAGIQEVYAETLSCNAKEIFEQNRISHEWKELVDNILDEKKQDMCPFEKEAANITNPKEAYDKFKTLRQKLKTCR